MRKRLRSVFFCSECFLSHHTGTEDKEKNSRSYTCHTFTLWAFPLSIARKHGARRRFTCPYTATMSGYFSAGRTKKDQGLPVIQARCAGFSTFQRTKELEKDGGPPVIYRHTVTVRVPQCTKEGREIMVYLSNRHDLGFPLFSARENGGSITSAIIIVTVWVSQCTKDRRFLKIIS